MDDRPIGRSSRYIPPELRAPSFENNNSSSSFSSSYATTTNNSSNNNNDKNNSRKIMKNKEGRDISGEKEEIDSLDKRVERMNLDSRRPKSYGEKYNYDVVDENNNRTTTSGATAGQQQYKKRTLFDKGAVGAVPRKAGSVGSNTNNSKKNKSYPDTIKEAATRLTDSKSYSWKLRLCAIEFLQNEVKDVNKHDAISASLVMLLNPLIAQCRDLRSAIVRETCNLLTLCAKNLQDKFSTIAPAVTKVLLMITGGGNKVIAGYCSECAIEIVKHTQSKKSINLFVSLCKSRSKVVREKALTCLCICLEAWSPTNWLHNTKNINNGITIGLNDPSPTARQIAKRAYEAFELHSPEDAQSLMATLDKRTISKLNSSSKSLSVKSRSSSSSSSKSLNSSSSSSFSSSLKRHRRRPSTLDSRLIDTSGAGNKQKEDERDRQPPPSPPSSKECKEWVLTQRVKGDPVCYWNSRTNETTWTDHWVPFLKEIKSGSNKNDSSSSNNRRRYYYNVETKKTSWNLPEKKTSPRHIDSNTPKNI